MNIEIFNGWVEDLGFSDQIEDYLICFVFSSNKKLSVKWFSGKKGFWKEFEEKGSYKKNTRGPGIKYISPNWAKKSERHLIKACVYSQDDKVFDLYWDSTKGFLKENPDNELL